jgi:predicted TIM-barrel fold metal-dependent hydrolase
MTQSLDYNRIGLDYRLPMPRPKVNGIVIDCHVHLLSRRHCPVFFEAADHYGIDCFVSMTPLEEAIRIQRDYPGRVRFIAVPSWGDKSSNWIDNWRRHIDAFYNLGSRIVKFHLAPGSMQARKVRLDEEPLRSLVRESVARGMIIMTHIGDPETWYRGRYADAGKFGTRDEHYRMWESVLSEYPNHPWLGAHLGGNPEDLPRLQRLLDTYPKLCLDTSATKWLVREVSARRDAAREFIIRNQDRILFGSDQVSTDDRGFDFLASRFWCHRKLWETAHSGQTPIHDPDCPDDQQPILRGLALPDEVLQKIYHDNPIRFYAQANISFEGWG